MNEEPTSVRELLRFKFNDDQYGGADIRIWTVDKIEGTGNDAVITLNNYTKTKQRTMTAERLLEQGIGINGDKKRLTEIVNKKI